MFIIYTQGDVGADGEKGEEGPKGDKVSATSMTITAAPHKRDIRDLCIQLECFPFS